VSVFYVSHSIVGRLHVVSKIEAESEEDALEQTRAGADDDAQLIVGEVFVMDRHDGQDEYEIVDESVLRTPGFTPSTKRTKP
jgi:hypothetical protein